MAGVLPRHPISTAENGLFPDRPFLSEAHAVKDHQPLAIDLVNGLLDTLPSAPYPVFSPGEGF